MKSTGHTYNQAYLYILKHRVFLLIKSHYYFTCPKQYMYIHIYNRARFIKSNEIYRMRTLEIELIFIYLKQTLGNKNYLKVNSRNSIIYK